MATLGGSGAVGGGGTVLMGFDTAEKPAISGFKNLIGAMGGLSGAAIALTGALGGIFTKKALDEAVEFEEELADLEKLLGSRAAEPLAESIAELSTEMPIARRELMGIAEQAARFGIRGKENIMEFTRVIGEAAVATDATSDEAAEALVKISAVTQEPISNVRTLADSLNELSNTTATSFSELIQSAGQLAPALSTINVDTEQIFALASASNEVNISVRRGARRLRRFFQQLRDTGFLEDVADALDLNVEKLRELIDQGKSVKILQNVAAVMQEGGEASRLLTDAMTSASNQGVAALSQNLLGLVEALETSKEQFDDGGSLAEEYSIRVGTAANRQQLLNNQVQEAQREFGEGLLPVYRDTLEILIDIADALDSVGEGIDPETIIPESDLEKLNERLNKQFIVEPVVSFAIEGLTDAGRRIGFPIPRMTTKQKARLQGVRQEVLRLVDSIEDPELSGEFFAAALRTIEQFETEGLQPTQKEAEELRRQLQLTAQVFTPLGFAAGEGAAQFQKFEIAGQQVKTLNEETRGILQDLEQDYRELTMTEKERVLNKLREIGATEDAMRTARRLLNLLEEEREEEERRERAQERRQERAEEIRDRWKEQQQTIGELRREREALRIELLEGEAAADRYRASQKANTEQEKKLRLQVLRLKEALDRKNKSMEEAEDRAEEFQERIKEAKFQTMASKLRLLEDAAREISSSFTTMVEDIVTGSESIEDAVTKMFANIAQTLSQQILTQMIFGLVAQGMLSASGLGSGGGANSNTMGMIFGFGSPSATPFASGGPISAGQLALVGEQGPEFFVPNTAGTVVPNDRTGNVGGETLNVNVKNEFSVDAMDGRSVQRALKEQMPFIAQGITQEIDRSFTLKRRVN